MAFLYVVAGINHFVDPNFYLQMIPDYLTFPKLLIILSGVAEIFLGLLLLIPKTQKFAAQGLILLLIAIFPANIYMFQKGSSYFPFSDLSLLLRLPAQVVLISWAYWHCRQTQK